MNRKILVGILLIAIILLGIKVIVLHKGGPHKMKFDNKTESIDSARSEAYKEYNDSIKEAFKATSGPITIFDPRISPSEKTELQTKILNPYSAFHAPKGTKVFIIQKISKDDQSKSGTPSSYQVSATNNDGSTEEWLVAQTDTSLDYWIPSCLGDCKFTPYFQKEYPEVVKRYKKVALDQK